jgi:hypothetical protein
MIFRLNTKLIEEITDGKTPASTSLRVFSLRFISWLMRHRATILNRRIVGKIGHLTPNSSHCQRPSWSNDRQQRSTKLTPVHLYL